MNFIKVGDHVLKVEFDQNNKMNVRNLTEQEIMELDEEALFGAGKISVIDHIQKSVDEARTKILGNIQEEIKDIIYKTLGFSNRYGKWEIDTNTQRSNVNVIGDIISKEVKDKIASATTDSLAISKKELDTMQKVARGRFRDVYAHALQQFAREEAHKFAKEAVAKTVKELLHDDIVAVAKEAAQSIKANKEEEL